MQNPNQHHPQAGHGRPLPKKEADLFRNVVKFYETKQYKKAIKAADAILKKFPLHGETLAMKGLTVNAMHNRDINCSGNNNNISNSKEKYEEAHELVKKALRYDMRSHVCWHVYGLLHRSDHHYNDAIKAYKQALRIDPANAQILRDLSMLQIHMRDYEGFAVTRNTLLTQKPSMKLNWLAFALSKHLLGEHRDAVKVIDIYLGTLTDQNDDELGRSVESSELALYKNRILAEMPSSPKDDDDDTENNDNRNKNNNNWQEALDHLHECEDIVVDRTSWLELRAQYQLALHDFVGCQQSIMALFDRGLTEYFRVHTLFMCCILQFENWALIQEALQLRGTQTLATLIPLPREQQCRIRDVYINELLPRYPTSFAIQSIPVTLLCTNIDDGDDNDNRISSNNTLLLKAIKIRCREGLSKGIPSLCSELQSFVWLQRDGRFVRPDDPVDYASHPVYSMIVALVETDMASLEISSKFAESSSGDNTTITEQDASSILFWTWFLRAGLYELVADYQSGLALVDKCLVHSPDIVDVYELKARLLLASGGAEQAAECINIAREMDLQDRYLNNLTTRYMLRAGMDDQARKLISLFAKHEGNPEQNLFDMQCSWYELEVAAHFYRKRDWGRSLKYYAAVVKHFEDINEDQFDFHGYCMRKVALRAYVDMLRFEDEIYGQEFYVQAASGMVRIYLHLMDHPISNADADAAEPDYSSMTAAEKKKAKAIARKKKKAAEKKEEATCSIDGKVDKEVDSGYTNGCSKSSSHDSIANNTLSTSKPKVNANGSKSTSLFETSDAQGKDLLIKDAAEEARKYSSILIRFAPRRLETWLLCYDVAIRRGKMLLAMKALYQVQSVSSHYANNGEVLWRTVDFLKKVEAIQHHHDENGSVWSDTVRRVVTHEMLPLLQNHDSIESLVQFAVERISSSSFNNVSLSDRVGVAQSIMLLSKKKAQSVSKACELITNANVMKGRGVTVESCRLALTLLQSFGDEAIPAVERWVCMVKAQFPLVTDL